NARMAVFPCCMMLCLGRTRPAPGSRAPRAAGLACEVSTVRALPLPACGERVGVRGALRESESLRLSAPSCLAPHPDLLPAQRGEGAHAPCSPHMRLHSGSSPAFVHAVRAAGATSARRNACAASGAALPAPTAPTNTM